MFKSKTKFNPKSLSFEKVPFSIKRLLMLVLPHSFVAILLAVGLLTLYMIFFETPEEQLLRAENRYLKANYKELSQKFYAANAQIDDIAKRDNEIYRIIFELDSIPMVLRNAGHGGGDKYAEFEGFSTSGLVIDVARKIDILEKKLEIQTESLEEIANLANEKSNLLRRMPVLFPLHNASLQRIGSYYGYRRHPIFKVRLMHHGVDLTAALGTPVYAAGDGLIVRTETNRSRRGYGNLVVIDHGIGGFTSWYAHLNTIEVKKGQKIKRGERLGTVGNTGQSTSPHLHFEIRIEGNSTDPLKYLINISPEQYSEMLEMSAIEGGISFD
ncbi:MAG: M23 family metallopeptidase [Bacteroidales bacterium]|nr:M23 family metallopeptidase [Bacteroidales bacterium]